MSSPSLNPQIFPQATVKKDHHKVVNLAIITALVAVIVGLVYWWSAQKQKALAPVQTAPVVQTVDPKVTMANSLRNNPAPALSTEERAAIVGGFKKHSAPTPSAADREQMTLQLQNAR